MNVTIPPAILDLGPSLTEFVEEMVHKLNINSHKDAINEDDIDGLLAKMQGEIAEFREQRIQDASDPNILSELADTSNFAFLIYAFLRARGLKTMKERFIDEFFRIDPETGKVFCAKTRSGSGAKVGEEIVGTMRKGRVYIRAQHSASGATISVPRSDLIYWAWSGQWPRQPLRYINGNMSDDRITNLDLVEDTVNGKRYPFVSQYKPKGRENTENYGKFVYQRRHAFALVRVGYWDTEEEAAREGVIAWKARVKEKKVCLSAN